jgi:hypothetical protein
VRGLYQNPMDADPCSKVVALFVFCTNSHICHTHLLNTHVVVFQVLVGSLHTAQLKHDNNQLPQSYVLDRTIHHAFDTATFETTERAAPVVRDCGGQITQRRETTMLIIRRAPIAELSGLPRSCITLRWESNTYTPLHITQ